MNNSITAKVDSPSSRPLSWPPLATDETSGVRLSEEFERFFREPDEADASLPPTPSLSTEEATPVSPDQAAKQAARRRYFTKLVMTIVGACVLLLTVALCLKAYSSRKTALDKPQLNSSVSAASDLPAAAPLPVAEVPLEASPPIQTPQPSAPTSTKQWRPKHGVTAYRAKAKRAKTAAVAATREKRRVAAKAPAKSAPRP